MANERLRRALLERGIGEQTIATDLQVDPKTVARWVAGRTPNSTHRVRLASLLGVEQASLWPTVQAAKSAQAKPDSEIIRVHPHRRSMPHLEWRRFFESATTELGILVHSGMWLVEDPGVRDILRERGQAGVRVRLLLGDPESVLVADDDRRRGVPGVNGVRVAHAVQLMQPLAHEPGIELRLHSTVLYNAIFRADDELLVNPRIYGARATLAPVLHLRRVPRRTLVSTYIDSFEQVWAEARQPCTPER